MWIECITDGREVTSRQELDDRLISPQFFDSFRLGPGGGGISWVTIIETPDVGVLFNMGTGGYAFYIRKGESDALRADED